MKRMIVIAMFAVSMSVAHAAKCPLPGEWKLDLDVSDEFNAEELDKAKWWDYAPRFPGRPGVYRTLAKNVAQSGGDLCLTVDKVPDDQIPYEARMDGMKGFTCAMVKSKKKVMYGYFEARIKANPCAVRNAFWLYDPHSDNLAKKYAPGDVSEEIDIMEIVGKHQPEDAAKPYVVSFFTHHYLTPYYEGVCNANNVPLGFVKNLPFCPSEDYHVYGLLWTEDEIVWFVDNVEYARMTTVSFGNGGFRRPLHVVLDNEVCEWNGAKVDTLDPKTLPSVQKVDWFRRWVQVQPAK
jgi:beta-glucanase (GH16 family)